MLGKKESKHYCFYYPSNSVAEAEIDEIVKHQEQCFQYISQVLKVNYPYQIEYYLCNSREEVGQYYGDDEPCSGFARRPNQVYAVYNETHRCIGFHEDAHLISYTINRPKSAAIREGLAMFFDRKWWEIHTMEWVQFYLKHQSYESISDLLDDEHFFNVSDCLTYPIMGQFTEYLILIYGIETYLDFYRYQGTDFKSAFEQYFKKSIHQIETEFIGYLSLFTLDEGVENQIQTLLQKG